ncbi:MAG TPA: N-acetylmuramoyl-L-alanine amidase, partial [Nitrospirota bacterium]
MLNHGRSCIAAFMACAVTLLATTAAYPSYNTEAGRKYSIACQRLADLRKSPQKKKYRTYWIDCIRTFELVEKRYPKSPSAGDSCFDRAGIYQDLFQFNKYSKDLNESFRVYGSCQSLYPTHPRAPEALFRIIDLSLNNRKDPALISETLDKLAVYYSDSPWTAKARARLNPSMPAVRKGRKPETEIRRMPAPVIAAPGKKRSAGVVKSIRHWSEGDYTRIVIDQYSTVRFQAQELKNPDRLVFDLLNARVDASMNKDPLPINDGILKQVRASQYAPDVVRVVLDLESIKSYVAFPLHDPERLVIDVTGERGRGPANPVATADTTMIPQESPPDVQSPLNAENRERSSEAMPPVPRMPDVKAQDNEKLSLSRQLGLKIRTIAIDAGHGGHDPGAIGKNGTREKNITLDIARRLAALVRERLGSNVIMTRDRDVFIPLEQRPFIAKSKNADLFVSIHVNATRKRKARGIETYIQSLRASDRDAMATAAFENATSTKTLSQLGNELDRILKDLRTDDKQEESLQLAHAVQSSLVGNMKPVNGHVVNLGVKRAFFYVLINTEMPSILAEVGFITNPEEEKMLKQESHRQKIAEALFQGVKQFV